MRLYVPFLDDAIGYDCGRCGGSCCREGRILCTEDEAAAIRATHPALELFRETDTPAGSALSGYGKLHPACFFLEAQGRCRVQATKPLLCRAHPLYLTVFAEQGVAIAGLQPWCAWNVGGARDGRRLSARDAAALLEELERKGLTADFAPPLPAFATFPGLARQLELEERIRDTGGVAGSLADHLRRQLAVSEGRTAAAEWLTRAEAAIARCLELGDGWLAECGATPLVPFLPLLRLHAQARVLELGLPWPPAAPRPRWNRVLVGALLALAAVGTAWRRLVAGTEPPFALGFGEASRLLHRFPHRILALACFPELAPTIVGHDLRSRVRELDRMGAMKARSASA